jgi:PAS domain S-box-containing protein
MTLSPSTEVTVLHVDDQPDFVGMASTFLEREDDRLAVETRTDVDDALDRLRSDGVDCVVSDYDMPGKNGLDFLELVRDSYPDLPFVLFTGKGSEEIASRAISAGVDDYLQKQPTSDQYTLLAHRVLTLVRQRHAEEAARRTEERYHNLVDTAPVPILLFGEDKRLVYANDAAVDFFGADSMAEIAERPFTDFLHPEERPPSEERFERLMREDVSVPERAYRIVTVDGDVVEATVTTAPGTYQGEPVAQAIVRYRASDVDPAE